MSSTLSLRDRAEPAALVAGAEGPGVGEGVGADPVRRAITSSARRRISSAVGGACPSVAGASVVESAGSVEVDIEALLTAESRRSGATVCEAATRGGASEIF